MNMKHPSGLLLSALCVALFLTSCASKNKTDPPKPSLFSSVKSMIFPGDSSVPQAIIVPLYSDLKGYSFATAMKDFDLAQLNAALQEGRSHQTTSWINKDSGQQYAITPYPVFQDPQGRYCREFTVESFINGREESVRSIACRPANGLWNVQG